MALATSGRQAGPLELLTVSTGWQRLLLDTPSLWSQIYIQNGQDEMAQISTFLYLSKGHSLHLDIMGVLPNTECLQPIAENISRVKTISIRPGGSDTTTTLHMGQWKQAASCILAKLANGVVPSDIKYASCFGYSLTENGQLYYSTILMQFTMATPVATAKTQNNDVSAILSAAAYSRIWEEYIARCVSISHWHHTKQNMPNTAKSTTRVSADHDTMARTDSVNSIANLASCGGSRQITVISWRS
jgi:hypothetical protein